MTIIEAVSNIDMFKPNNYTQADKVEWLSRLDWSIKKEIIDTHEGADKVTFGGYNDDTSLDTELIVPPPFDEIYLRWLEAQIDYANAEYGKYNNSMMMYNTAYSAFANYYNRHNMPLGKQLKIF